ncbi:MULTISPECIES: chemotaxis protein CheA [unclassified Pannonibacter]|uniref:chemotaxis protein CheA n=1 Tax=unclassified Pannonibacter TaxID=2627228 RepID=UPI0016484DE5|nr:MULTISPECIES: chemotaxis protein CheA [unclassified Pannonibacter]
MQGTDFASDLLAEAAEHLDAIEPLLVGAETGPLSRVDIDLLFRAFHSLKGLARVAGISQLEELTHQAEACLYPVRHGRKPLEAPAIDALLRLVDGIRRAIGSGDLASFLAQEGLAQDLEQQASASSAGLTADFPEQTVALDALGLEPEMSRAFAELLSELLDEFASAQASGDLDALRQTAAVLVHGCARLGLHGLERCARMLTTATPGDCPRILAGIINQARTLENLTGIETGWAEASMALGEPLEPSDPAAAPSPPSLPDLLAARLSHWKVALHHLPRQASPALDRFAEDPAARLAEVVLPAPGAQRLAGLVSALPGLIAGRSVKAAEGPGLALLIAVTTQDMPEGLEAADTRTALPGLESAGLVPVSVTWLDGISAPVHFGEQQAVPRLAAAEETQVRVPVEVLDRLFGRIGSFFTLGSRLNVLASEGRSGDALRRLYDYASARAPEMLPEVEALMADRRDFLTLEAEVSHFISLIHESTLGLRVIPFENIIARFPRMVRDAARDLGKSVRFEQTAGSIKIDKGMADMLIDPLMHIIRNAIDHGIETPQARINSGKPATARLTLTAEQHGNRLVLTVSDDGRGIDIARVGEKAIAQRLASADDLARMSSAEIARFIFTPGFSTREEASTVSGRGVGMDVVLVNVTRLGGRIEIDTEPGRGTAFRMDMPLSAAIRPMLLADTGRQTIGFPETMVAEAAVFPADAVQPVNGHPSLLLRGRFLPLFDICELMNLPEQEINSQADFSVVICSWKGRRAGFRIARILRRTELLIRETHLRVAELPGVGGISILGADRIVLVLDPDKLFGLAARAVNKGLRSADGVSP